MIQAQHAVKKMSVTLLNIRFNVRIARHTRELAKLPNILPEWNPGASELKV
jgi:uncharacterized membrane protein SirB2